MAAETMRNERGGERGARLTVNKFKDTGNVYGSRDNEK